MSVSRHDLRNLEQITVLEKYLQDSRDRPADRYPDPGSHATGAAEPPECPECGEPNAQTVLPLALIPIPTAPLEASLAAGGTGTLRVLRAGRLIASRFFRLEAGCRDCGAPSPTAICPDCLERRR